MDVNLTPAEDNARDGAHAIQHLRPAVAATMVFTLLCGAAYPLAVTAFAGLAFPAQAGGSLVTAGGRVVGSELIGQQFTGAGYFWSRPSATMPQPYNGAASGGSNLGASSQELALVVEERVRALRASNPGTARPIPVDLVTASGSGLDPHISVAAAEFQVDRVARARGLEVDVPGLLAQYREPRQLGILGEPRVNVLALNMALDRRELPRGRRAPPP